MIKDNMNYLKVVLFLLLTFCITGCSEDNPSILDTTGLEIKIGSIAFDCPNATVYCKIMSTNPDNFDQLEDYGICYDTINGVDITKRKISIFPGEGNVKSEYSYLFYKYPIDTKYYVKPYWEYNDQIYYGEQKILDFSLDGNCNPNMFFDYWLRKDTEGNYNIINNLDVDLLLYVDGVPFAGIPSNKLTKINIPVKEGSFISINLVPWASITDPYKEPSNNSQTLPAGSFELPITYLFNSLQYSTMAQLNLIYYEGTDKNVDVHLDGKTGHKIASLKPGGSNSIYMSYGFYTLHYLFWQEAGNSFEELGWIVNHIINDNVVDIMLVLNKNRDDISLSIPHYGDKNTGTLYCPVTIQNKTGVPVLILLDNKLIENTCYLSSSTTNISTIPHNGTLTYNIPIHEKNTFEKSFNLKAVHPQSGNELEEANLIFKYGVVTNWLVDGK